MKNNMIIILITVSLIAVAVFGSTAIYVNADNTLAIPTTIPSVPPVPKAPSFPFPGPSPTPTPTPTAEPTITPTPMPTLTPTPTPIPTPTAEPSVTPVPTVMPAPTTSPGSPEVNMPIPTTSTPANDYTAPTPTAIVPGDIATPTPMANTTQIPIININKEEKTGGNSWLLWVLLLLGLVAIVIGVRTAQKKK